MDFNLNEEQLLLQENIFESAKKTERSISNESRWKTVAATGISGLCIEEEFGGSGKGALEMIIALEAFAKGNPDNGLSFSLAAHTLACVIPIAKFGSTSQKKKFLPSLINGDLIAANAMTESESGSDVFNMLCKAVKKNENYLLNGTKTFVSNSTVANLVLTYALTNTEKGFFGGITAFLVEKNKFKTGTVFAKMGLESCPLGEIIFEDSGLTSDNILGKEGGGAVIFNVSMEWERICMAGIHLGAMKRVLDKTLEFVKTRKSQGKALSGFQSISHSLAGMATTLEVARTYAYKSAWLLDNQKSVGKEAAITKLFVSNSVKDFMLQAMQIYGGYGYTRDHGIEQEVRDALAATIYSGTSEIQKNIIAANLGI